MIDRNGRSVLLAALVFLAESAIVPPPWADPAFNPCASQPGGWQLIYWPPDKKCYRIFGVGYPCPDTMELAPGPDKGTPECNCPPGSAQHTADSRCYPLYGREPCSDGQFFAPVPSKTSATNSIYYNIADRIRQGECRSIEQCSGKNQLYWPKDGQCYRAYARGPCPDGQLFSSTESNRAIGQCECNADRMRAYYWPASATCHEHFTAGPCQERGGIFLPGPTCGCHPRLPQYHNATGRCYPLGGSGPCSSGHQFVVPKGGNGYHAQCVCKENHVKWFGDGACYRPFTRGPCSPGNMYSVNVTSTGMAIGCVPVPCTTGRLYFPGIGGCHKVGTQGPCPDGQVVLFQDMVKTSVEGISYVGMCGCPNTAQSNEPFYPLTYSENNSTKCVAIGVSRNVETNAIMSDNKAGKPPYAKKEANCGRRGLIAWSDGTCQQLYTQGPCALGEWVVPDRGKGTRKGRGWKMGKCECRPGYTLAQLEGKPVCQPPTVMVAMFLNNRTDVANN